MADFSLDSNFYTYQDYLNLVAALVAEGKTSGDEPTESRINFTHLNLQRMTRWDKTLRLDEALVARAAETVPQVWWVFSEAWCGDGAQNIPVLQKIAEASNGKIELRLLLRDENKELMAPYLTNGSLAIPKLVSKAETGYDLFTWGPRPSPAQQLMAEWRRTPNDRTFNDIEKELHLWYARDKGESIQKEMLLKLASLVTSSQFT